MFSLVLAGFDTYEVKHKLALYWGWFDTFEEQKRDEVILKAAIENFKRIQKVSTKKIRSILQGSYVKNIFVA